MALRLTNTCAMPYSRAGGVAPRLAVLTALALEAGSTVGAVLAVDAVGAVLARRSSPAAANAPLQSAFFRSHVSFSQDTMWFFSCRCPTAFGFSEPSDLTACLTPFMSTLRTPAFAYAVAATMRQAGSANATASLRVLRFIEKTPCLVLVLALPGFRLPACSMRRTYGRPCHASLDLAGSSRTSRRSACAGALPRSASFAQRGAASRAAATASSRELTPRARKRRRMWFLTVSVLRWSSAAICFVERPCSSRRSTST